MGSFAKTILLQTTGFFAARIWCNEWTRTAFINNNVSNHHVLTRNVWDLLVSLYMVQRLWFLFTMHATVFYEACPAQGTNTPRIGALDTYLLLEMSKHGSNALYDFATGHPDGYSMYLHHFLTVCLIGLSYATNYTCWGIKLIPYMLLTNPFQHLAKLMHNMFPGSRASEITFAMFFAAFFCMRVFLYPLFYFSALVLDTTIPDTVYLAANTALIALYFLQVYWFYRMIKILIRTPIHGAS